jgi:hypothetical protein
MSSTSTSVFKGACTVISVLSKSEQAILKAWTSDARSVLFLLP